jgi:ABC-type multidrug transport system fused ATPase/permease subunit
MTLATYGLTEALVTTLAIFFFVIWIWILITIIGDLFRDHEESGVKKAIWILFLVFIPFLTALLYLIVRGGGMRDRAVAEQAAVQKQMNQYIREQATAASPADELEKLSALRDKGTISAEEYEAMKAKITG